MDQRTFEAIVQVEGAFTFIAIPFSPREAWGTRPRFYVTGTINGVDVRGTLGAQGQDYFLRLGKAWMRDSGIEPGTTVDVSLSLEGPHEGNLPADILTAFSGSKKAIAYFNGLPSFYRKNYIRWIESAKREETRAKRIEEMIRLLEDGKREK